MGINKSIFEQTFTSNRNRKPNIRHKEEEDERVRLAEIAQNQRIEEENRRVKEWEKKFDEEQRLKEEELVRKFYSDETLEQENNQNDDNLETKTDDDNLKN